MFIDPPFYVSAVKMEFKKEKKLACDIWQTLEMAPVWIRKFTSTWLNRKCPASGGKKGGLLPLTCPREDQGKSACREPGWPWVCSHPALRGGVSLYGAPPVRGASEDTASLLLGSLCILYLEELRLQSMVPDSPWVSFAPLPRRLPKTKGSTFISPL